MTTTDDLLDRLSAHGAATAGKPRLVFGGWLLGAALLCAAGVSLLLTEAFYSVELYGLGPMVAKWGFSLSLILFCVLALRMLGKPGRNSGVLLALLALPFVPVAALLALELSTAGPMMDGPTWPRCLLAMAIMSPIGFAGAVLAVRSMAPTRLHSAGLVAGLFGGALAMTAYAPFCPELGMTFMTLYYCLPIVLMAGIGWMFGPRLLRW
ncbi:DUF1109 domain-containing protein [Aurantiacibacter gilvus]|uniref:DUF1109 domain-containing protein n=1 Tax=Aurantiacibacter gilvus TaxID=3139141 RepID=A0ABU9IDI6_9SPHN